LESNTSKEERYLKSHGPALRGLDVANWIAGLKK